MAHKVSFTIPNKPLGRADVEFIVANDDGRIGVLKVSQGTLVWFPPNVKWGYRMNWKKFDSMMQEHGKREEKR